MKGKFIFIMCVSFFLSFAAYGADGVHFELKAPDNIYPGREFKIAFRLENAEGQDFRAPKFNGCEVLAGPQVSRSSRFLMDRGFARPINCVDYIYLLKSNSNKKKIRIGSATIRVDGKLLESRSRTIPLSNVPKEIFSGESLFTAVVPEKVEVGESFKVLFVLKNAQGENFSLPAVKNCELLYGPSVSRSGGSSFWGASLPLEVFYTVILKAKKTGTVMIPAATVLVNGKILKSKKIKIRILPQSEQTRKKKFDEAQRKYQVI